jgi:hypothetical protein
MQLKYLPAGDTVADHYYYAKRTDWTVVARISGVKVSFSFFC